MINSILFLTAGAAAVLVTQYLIKQIRRLRARRALARAWQELESELQAGRAETAG